MSERLARLEKLTQAEPRGEMDDLEEYAEVFQRLEERGGGDG